MGDTPAIAFGLLSLALGILFHKKRAKIIRSGGEEGGGKGKTGGRGILPRAVLCRIISVLMFLGGVGVASSFVGDWLRGWDFSIGEVPTVAIAAIVAVVLGFAVLIDVWDGGGLKPITYGMIVMFPLLWATGGGSLSWPKAISAQAWSWVTGAM
ncbi:hypothetical protein ACQP2T_27980 [Nonomuraea sp. CA-143628]|uniref:hypothetical protein n=1 Tax=Nonomuraea sp. CA-143628 TaxID=3239997 RepID=UPI003D90BFDD